MKWCSSPESHSLLFCHLAGVLFIGANALIRTYTAIPVAGWLYGAWVCALLVLLCSLLGLLGCRGFPLRACVAYIEVSSSMQHLALWRKRTGSGVKGNMPVKSPCLPSTNLCILECHGRQQANSDPNVHSVCVLVCVCRWVWLSPRFGSSLRDVTVASCSSAVFLWYSLGYVLPSLCWLGGPLRALECCVRR